MLAKAAAGLQRRTKLLEGQLLALLRSGCELELQVTESLVLKGRLAPTRSLMDLESGTSFTVFFSFCATITARTSTGLMGTSSTLATRPDGAATGAGAAEGAAGASDAGSVAGASSGSSSNW